MLMFSGIIDLLLFNQNGTKLHQMCNMLIYFPLTIQQSRIPYLTHFNESTFVLLVHVLCLSVKLLISQKLNWNSLCATAAFTDNDI